MRHYLYLLLNLITGREYQLKLIVLILLNLLHWNKYLLTFPNFQERNCIVLGKGNSEREVYFSAKSKMYIKKYLEMRTDNNEALFVSLIKPYNRSGISGIEILIRNLGKEANINKVHPHKFRKTMATMAIDKGMPIEQVQKLLGHIKIDTTMEYAMVNQNNVKNSHRKYIT